MTQQATITQLTAPTAPKNDAAFISSTTAPQSLIFRPGDTFPNNGPVRQNVFTSPNASGTDGLLLMQEILLGLGLFPAIPLPSSLVEFDFSLVGNNYTLTSSIQFGANCSIRAIDGTRPTLTGAAGFNISATVGGSIRLIDGVNLATVAGCDLISSGITQLTIRNATLSGSAGAIYVATGADTLFFENVTMTAAFGIITTGGSVLTLNLSKNSSVAAGTVNKGIGSTLNLFIQDPSVSVDPSVLAIADSVTYGFNVLGSIVFQPSGTTVAPNYFHGEGDVQAAAQTQMGPTPIYFDFSAAGDGYNAGGDLNFGSEATWIGSPDQTTAVYPTLNTAFQTTTPIEIRDLFVVLSGAAITFTTTPGNLTLSGETDIQCSPGTILYNLDTGSFASLFMKDQATLGDGTNPCITVGPTAGDDLDLVLEGNASLLAGAITASGAGTVHVSVASPGVTIDPSYFTNAAFIISYAFTPPATVTFSPGGGNAGTTFVNFAQLCGHIKAVGSLVESWQIQCDGTFVGEAITIPAGTYPLDLQIEFVGQVSDGTTSLYPTLTFAPDVIFNPPPNALRFSYFVSVSIGNTAFPVCFIGGGGADSFLLELLEVGVLECTGPEPLLALTGGSFGCINLRGVSDLGGTGAIISVDTTSSLAVTLEDQAMLEDPAVSLTGGATLTIRMGAGTTIGDGYFTLANTTYTLPVGAAATGTFGATPNAVVVGVLGNTFITIDGGSAQLWIKRTNPTPTTGWVSVDDAFSIAYTPTTLADWSGVPPTSVGDALDRIAARISPIP